MMANLSRPEIADQLSVSANTVGTHLRNIYAKLGVQDRSSAARRTRELRAAGGRAAAGSPSHRIPVMRVQRSATSS